MNFSEITIPEQVLETKEEKRVRVTDKKRFVISCDPYDEDTILARQQGKNVFIVYDKHNQRISTKAWTTKSFNEFVDWFLKDAPTKIPYIVSHKFINKDGKSCSLGEANPGSVPFERFNDTF